MYNLLGEKMKKFNMIDEEFICENCNKHVQKLEYSARDHCPYCLYSKHVDINPGDRNNKCHGMLIPIDIEKYKNTYKIIIKISWQQTIISMKSLNYHHIAINCSSSIKS